MFSSKEGVKQYPEPCGPWGKCLSFSVIYAYSPSCLWAYVSFSPLGTSMGPIPSLTFPID